MPTRSFAALMVVPLCWGASFPILKFLVQGMPTSVALCLRFGLAALALRPFAGSAAQRRAAWPYGGPLGALHAAIYALVAHALQHSAAPRVGFLMGLSVVCVPFIDAVQRGALPRRLHLLAAAVSLLGLATFSQFSFAGLQPGEPGVLLAALLFAGSTVLLHRATAAGRQQPFALSMTQCAVTAACWLPGALWQAVAAAPMGPGALAGFDWRLGAALLYGALLPTVGCQLLIARFQADLDPPVAATIFVLQSVFNLATATLLFGERLTPAALGGGLLIFAATLLPGLGDALSAGWRRAKSPAHRF